MRPSRSFALSFLIVSTLAASACFEGSGGPSSAAPEAPRFLEAAAPVWNQWRMNAAKNPVITTMSGAITTPVVKWKVPADGLGEGSAVVADIEGKGEMDVIISSYGSLKAIRGKSGQVIWSVAINGQYNISTPAVADLNGDGKLEVIHGQNQPVRKISCYNAKDGTVKWEVPVAGEGWSSAAVADLGGDGKLKVVYASSNDFLYALNADGSIYWKVPIGFSIYGSPAIGDVDGDGKLDVVCSGGFNELLVFNGQTGALKWSQSLPASIKSTPVIIDVDQDGKTDIVFTIDGYGIYAVRGDNGQQKWFAPFQGNNTLGLSSSPVVADMDGDGKLDVVAGAADHNVYCVRGDNGALKWTFNNGGTQSYQGFESSASVADINGDGTLDVVIGSHTGYVYALDGKTGHKIWEFLAGGGEGKVVSSPTLADIDGDGKLEVIFGSNAGDYWCLGPGTVAQSNAWNPGNAAGSGGSSGTTVLASTSAGSATGAGAPSGNGSNTSSSSAGSNTSSTSGQNASSPLASGTTPATLFSTQSTPAPASTVVGGLAGPWPIWRGDIRNTGYQKLKGALSSPTLRFEANCGLGESTPAVGDVDGDGKLEIVTFSYAGYVRVFNGQTGALKWEKQVASYSAQQIASPTLVDLDGNGKVEILVCGKDDHMLYALRGSNGDVLWTFNLGGSAMGTPTVADVDGDGHLDIIVNANGTAFALRADGTQIWSNNSALISIHSAAAVADVDGKPVLIFGTWLGLVALEGATGQVKWTALAGGTVQSSPVIADLNGDGKLEVVAASPQSGVYAFDAKTGQQKWYYAWPSTSIGWQGSPAVADLNGDGVLDVVAGSGTPDHTLYAINGGNGQLLWKFVAGDWLEPSPLIWDGDGDGKVDVVCRAYNNTMWLLNGQTGQPKWDYVFTSLGGNAACSPIAADLDGNGVAELIIQNSNGKVMVFGKNP